MDFEHAQQSIGNPHFGNYLYQHSRWIQDLFTFIIPLTGGYLDEDHSQGEGVDELFGPGELEMLLTKLRSVPRPSDDNAFLAWNYDHLMLLVTAAVSGPQLTLARAVY